MTREDVVVLLSAAGFEVVVSSRAWLCYPVAGVPAEPSADDCDWLAALI